MAFRSLATYESSHALKELPILVMTAKTLTAEEIAILGRDTQAFFQKDGPGNNI